MQGRLPEGATEGRLPEQATPAPHAASSSHVGTGSTTPSHVTDDSAPDSIPNHVTEAPAPTPAYLPTSPTSVTSPRALNHMDSHRSTRSTESTGSNGNLAMSQSKEQSRQLLEKASQKLASLLVNANDKNFDAARRPGEAAIRRAPQASPSLLALWHAALLTKAQGMYYQQHLLSKTVFVCTTSQLSAVSYHNLLCGHS